MALVAVSRVTLCFDSCDYPCLLLRGRRPSHHQFCKQASATTSLAHPRKTAPSARGRRVPAAFLPEPQGLDGVGLGALVAGVGGSGGVQGVEDAAVGEAAPEAGGQVVAAPIAAAETEQQAAEGLEGDAALGGEGGAGEAGQLGDGVAGGLGGVGVVVEAAVEEARGAGDAGRQQGAAEVEAQGRRRQRGLRGRVGRGGVGGGAGRRHGRHPGQPRRVDGQRREALGVQRREEGRVGGVEVEVEVGRRRRRGEVHGRAREARHGLEPAGRGGLGVVVDVEADRPRRGRGVCRRSSARRLAGGLARGWARVGGGWARVDARVAAAVVEAGARQEAPDQRRVEVSEQALALEQDLVVGHGGQPAAVLAVDGAALGVVGVGVVAAAAAAAVVVARRRGPWGRCRCRGGSLLLEGRGAEDAFLVLGEAGGRAVRRGGGRGGLALDDVAHEGGGRRRRRRGWGVVVVVGGEVEGESPAAEGGAARGGRHGGGGVVVVVVVWCGAWVSRVWVCRVRGAKRYILRLYIKKAAGGLSGEWAAGEAMETERLSGRAIRLYVQQAAARAPEVAPKATRAVLEAALKAARYAGTPVCWYADCRTRLCQSLHRRPPRQYCRGCTRACRAWAADLKLVG